LKWRCVHKILDSYYSTLDGCEKQKINREEIARITILIIKYDARKKRSSKRDYLRFLNIIG
jgi:hypothetical protein